MKELVSSATNSLFTKKNNFDMPLLKQNLQGSDNKEMSFALNLPIKIVEFLIFVSNWT